MGAVESFLGNLTQRLLMPKEVPDWFAGGNRRSLPEAPPGSLLLLGHVSLQVADLEVSKRFYVDALGFSELAVDASVVRVGVGSSEFRLQKRKEPQAWPGHFYLWVKDMKATLEKCQALQAELGVSLVEGVHNVTSEDTVDALELHDPDGHVFLVNQVPRNFTERLRKTVRGGCPETQNALALVESFHVVPPGVSLQVAGFYKQFFGAAVTVSKGKGWSVHFAPNKSLRQTLVFADDDEQTISMESTHEVCIYVESEERLKACFDKCLEADIVAKSSGDWDKVVKAGEFRVIHCLDPKTKSSALELESVVRLPSHSECLLDLEAQTSPSTASPGASPAPGAPGADAAGDLGEPAKPLPPAAVSSNGEKAGEGK